MSGGEPTLVQAGKEFIDYCIEKDYAKDIKLRYVINLTNLTEEFISKFKKFKSVDFHCSIDGLYEVNDYLRYPSDFKTIANNLHRLQKTNAKLIMIIYTASIFNIYRTPEIIEWLEMFDRVSININPLNEPFMYHPNILDDETKNMIKSELLSFETTPKLRNEIESLVQLMDTEIENKDKYRKEFALFVDAQDKVRKQSFCDTFPELKSFYEMCKNV